MNSSIKHLFYLLFQVRSFAGRVYMLELCRNSMKSCNTSDICRQSKDDFVYYGNKPITIYDYAHNAVLMLYVGGECTKDGKFQSVT